jgi:hypothetical protein
MAKTNFQYEKRQRELEKKRKADDKARRKLEAKLPKGPDEEGAAGEPQQQEQQEQLGAAAAEQGARDPA